MCNQPGNGDGVRSRPYRIRPECPGLRSLYDPSAAARGTSLAREQRKLAAILAADVVGMRLSGREQGGLMSVVFGAWVALQRSRSPISDMAETSPAQRRTAATAAPPGPACKSTTAMPSKAGACPCATLASWNRSSIRRPAWRAFRSASDSSGIAPSAERPDGRLPTTLTPAASPPSRPTRTAARTKTTSATGMRGAT